MDDPDLKRPSAGRIYDYLLGGSAAFAADRRLAEELMTVAGDCPGLRELARENRRFILEATGWLASFKGIAQFLDLGAGLRGHGEAVHDAARRAIPAARVAYADRDPVVLWHLRGAVKREGPGLAAIGTDIRSVGAVLRDKALRGVIDLAEPAGVILGGTLSSMTAGEARETVAGYMTALPAGSAAVISCASWRDAVLGGKMAAMFAGAGEWHDHGAAEIASFFAAGGLRLVHGRVGDVGSWPLFTPPGRAVAMLGGVGLKD